MKGEGLVKARHSWDEVLLFKFYKKFKDLPVIENDDDIYEIVDQFLTEFDFYCEKQ